LRDSRTAQVGAVQVGADQVGAGQVGVAQVGESKICLLKMRARQNGAFKPSTAQ
jgi:hypothetical protein